MRYLLDANVFIEAQNRYYANDIVPAFWDWMDHVVGSEVGTVAPVRDELLVKDDILGDWVRARKDAAWILAVDDDDTQRVLATIAARLDKSSYLRPAVAKFLGGADPWLIAKAVVTGATIVTHEVPSKDAKSRVPIPNVCQPLNVRCVNTFEILRETKAQFHFRVA